MSDPEPNPAFQRQRLTFVNDLDRHFAPIDR